MTDRKQRIEKIAYQLWEQEGRPDGHSERLWLAAEAQYEAENAKAKYGAEIAKDRARQPAGAKPAGSGKSKSDEMPPAPPAMTKSEAPAKTKAAEPPAKTKAKAAEPATAKMPSVAAGKSAEPAAAKPSDSGKRKPGAK